MTDTDTYKRDAPLIRAQQELTQASELVRSAMNRCERDRRTTAVPFEEAWSAIADAQDALSDAMGVAHTALRPSVREVMGG